MPPRSRLDRFAEHVPAWLPIVLLLLALLVAAGGWAVGEQARATAARADVVTGELVVATEQRDATADQAVDLAVLIEGACASGDIPAEYAAACRKAETVQARPVPAVPGAPGVDGR
ncbi:MAG: hypothetical protein ACRCZP_07645, partial [Phycicoccus sp.]